MDRDLDIHRLTDRLRAVRRFGLDLSLGYLVSADDPGPVYVGRLGLTDSPGRRLLVDWRSPRLSRSSQRPTPTRWGWRAGAGIAGPAAGSATTRVCRRAPRPLADVGASWPKSRHGKQTAGAQLRGDERDSRTRAILPACLSSRCGAALRYAALSRDGNQGFDPPAVGAVSSRHRAAVGRGPGRRYTRLRRQSDQQPVRCHGTAQHQPPAYPARTRTMRRGQPPPPMRRVVLLAGSLPRTRRAPPSQADPAVAVPPYVATTAAPPGRTTATASPATTSAARTGNRSYAYAQARGRGPLQPPSRRCARPGSCSRSHW